MSMWDSKLKRLKAIRQSFNGEIFEFKGYLTGQMARSKSEEKTQKLNAAYHKLSELYNQMSDIKNTLKEIESL